MPSRPHQCFTPIAAALLFAACGPTEPDQTAAERTRQEQEKVVRDVGEMLITEVNKTLEDPPSDDQLMAQFEQNRDDYVAIADFVERHPEFNRFDRNNKPPDYSKLDGETGPISSMDPEIARRLLSDRVPAIIDGNLSDKGLIRRLVFVNFRAGTVVSGMAKGISYYTAYPPGALVESLDDLTEFPKSPNEEETGCAFRRIEDRWYLYVCT